jgi:tetratricopeptide (TPR) repeat protein
VRVGGRFIQIRRYLIICILGMAAALVPVHGQTKDPQTDSKPGSKTTDGVSSPAKSATEIPAFFDEPHFSVAGVTEAAGAGGHGSDTVLRTSEALAKSTLLLSEESSRATRLPASLESKATLQEVLARNPKDATLRHSLAEVEEKLGDPLAAVRDYQRAAELEPSEPNLFDWGTELLNHRALEPAEEVFAEGHRLFPKSVRMLIALGVTSNARGAYEPAEQHLVSACDLAPDDPTPYLFLGEMLVVEKTVANSAVERLARFAQRQPQNALANYYYAVALQRQALESPSESPSESPESENERSRRVESLLLKALDRDPKLGAADLQLGIFYAQRKDFPRAISAYQKAIAANIQPDETLAEAHFRLAQVYVQLSDKAKAQEQLELHAAIVKIIKDNTERSRRDTQEFVISLQRETTSSPQEP